MKFKLGDGNDLAEWQDVEPLTEMNPVDEQVFYCAEWSKVGYVCEEQCIKCANLC